MHCSRTLIIVICFGSWLCLCYALPARRIVQRRQVVQPTWLLRPSQLPSGQAAQVRVTPQNLKETAALRSSIQKAVQEGTYVVPSDPKQFQIALQQLGYNTAMLGSSASMPMMPQFAMPNATWWQSRLVFT